MARRLSPGVVADGPSATRPRERRSAVGDDDAHAADRGPRRARRGDPPGLRRRRGGALVRAAARAARRADAAWAGVHPVFFGSAARGVGIDELLAGVDELLSGAARRPGRAPSRAASSRSSGHPPASASPTSACSPARSGRASACASGAGRRRSRPRSGSSRRPARRGATCSSPGEMATVRGLGAVRVGDAIGEPPPGEDATARFPRPALEAVVFALRAGAAGIASGPPSPSSPSRTRSSTSARTTTATRSRSRSTARSRRRSSRRRSSATTASPPTSARRRPCASSARPASARPRRSSTRRRKTNITGRSSPLSTNPFMATLALRIEPAPPGSGIEFRADVEPRLVPLYLFQTPDAFLDQMEAYVREALAEGLAGWQVTDCRVTMTDCGYASPVTSAADFRRLTQLVLVTALERAGTWVCEPLADLSLEMPASTAPGRPGGARPARRPRHGPVLGERRDDARAPCLPVARVRRCSTSCPACRWGRGSSRRARRLPARSARDPPTRPALRARARSIATRGSPRWRSADRQGVKAC